MPMVASLVAAVALASCALPNRSGGDRGVELTMSFTSNLFTESELSGRTTLFGIDVAGSPRIVGGVVYAQPSGDRDGRDEAIGEPAGLDGGSILWNLLELASLDVQPDGLWPSLVGPALPGSKVGEMARRDPFTPDASDLPYLEWFSPAPFDCLRFLSHRKPGDPGLAFWSSQFKDAFLLVHEGRLPDLEPYTTPKLVVQAKGTHDREFWILASYSRQADGSLRLESGEVRLSKNLERSGLAPLLIGCAVSWDGNHGSFRVPHGEPRDVDFDSPITALQGVLLFLLGKVFSE